MLAEWIGVLVGQLHCHKVEKSQLAKEMGVTPEYVSYILNGHREPAGAEKRMFDALERILERRGRED